MTRADRLERLFPGLCESDYRIVSQESICYNCVAWAAGDNKRCWWPDEDLFWPSKEFYHETVRSFADTFSLLGYKPCADGALEPGVEKVAIYALGDTPQHMARQLLSGVWTSKIGDLDDIEHDLHAFEGDEYGVVVMILARKKVRAEADKGEHGSLEAPKNS